MTRTLDLATFTVPTGWQVEERGTGVGRFDKLFTGIVIGPPDRPSFIDDTDQSGKGGVGPEDTGELDYERLLEGARRSRERERGWCAQEGTAPYPQDREGQRERGWCALHDSNVRPPGS